MRIRKQQSRGSAGGESSGASLDPGSQEHELVQSSRGAKEKPGDEVQMLHSEVEGLKEEESGRQVIERVDSPSRSAFTWLDKLRYSKGFTEIEPYSNLEDFITSLLKDGGSSLKGRTVSNRDEVVEESELNRLNAQKLARHNSVCSGLSSKQASGVGPEGALSPALVSCNDSSMSAPLAQGYHLRSDASHPSAFKHCNVSGISVHDPRKEALSLESKHEKQERGGQSSKAIRKGCAGTSSEKPMHDEIRSGTTEGPCTDIARSQLGTVEAEFKQGLGSSKAEPRDTRFGTLLQIDQLQGPSETARRRSRRKWRISSFTDAERSHCPRDDAAAAAATTSKNPPPAFSQDHPALQPKDSLVFSLYTVCLRAGKPGLTAREAVSQMLHQGLSGLQEQGAVQSSRRIAKLFRKSPYYMELGEGKFALCSAVTNTSEESQPQPQLQPHLQDEPDSGKAMEFSTADISQKRRQMGEEEDEAQESESEGKSRPGRSGRPKKLKYMKQENVGELGNQCNRTDGKGWVCPLLAKPGYQLCDHHLDKLRCKPGSRSKKKKRTSNLAPAATPLDTAGHE